MALSHDLNIYMKTLSSAKLRKLILFTDVNLRLRTPAKLIR